MLLANVLSSELKTRHIGIQSITIGGSKTFDVSRSDERRDRLKYQNEESGSSTLCSYKSILYIYNHKTFTIGTSYNIRKRHFLLKYECRTESHEQLFFFACEMGTAEEEECGGRWNQLLCYP